METDQKRSSFKPTISASIIRIVAFIIAISGIFLLFTGSNGSNNIIGLASIISAAFLFIIANIPDDLRYQNYLKVYYGEAEQEYYKQSLQSIKAIEEYLYNHDDYAHVSQPAPQVTHETSSQEQRNSPPNSQWMAQWDDMTGYTYTSKTSDTSPDE